MGCENKLKMGVSGKMKIVFKIADILKYSEVGLFYDLMSSHLHLYL